MNIIFTNIWETDEIEMPKPAIEFIPDWYKESKSYINNEKKPSPEGISPATIKKCMPVFDALTAGYIITTPADVYVSLEDGKQNFQWSNFALIEWHPNVQAELHPVSNGFPYPKWNNPWGITTPKGYSTLFVQPMHRESVFTILPGIVDTDTYTIPVNFPMVINDPTFEGLIPKGTPMAQVIPFKRETWNITIGGKKEIALITKNSTRLTSKFFDKYKTMFRSKKEYR
jgi:hypothetical protein